MQPSNSLVLQLLAAAVISTVTCLPRAKRDTETAMANTDLKLDDKLADLGNSIQQLQEQLNNLQQQGSEGAPSEGAEQSEATRVKQYRLTPRRAGVGWQPLRKRRLTWQPLKRSQPARFAIRMRDSEGLQDEMIQAVESHLLEDLTAAQQYGIEPESILEDLRQRNGAGRE